MKIYGILLPIALIIFVGTGCVGNESTTSQAVLMNYDENLEISDSETNQVNLAGIEDETEEILVTNNTILNPSSETAAPNIVEQSGSSTDNNDGSNNIDLEDENNDSDISSSLDGVVPAQISTTQTEESSATSSTSSAPEECRDGDAFSAYIGTMTSESLTSYYFHCASYWNESSKLKVQSMIDELRDAEEEYDARQERVSKVSNTLSQLAIYKTALTAELTNITSEMNVILQEIEDVESQTIAQSFIDAQKSSLTSEYNSLYVQYQAIYSEISNVNSMGYGLSDYLETGAQLSSSDRSFLTSIGISW